MVYINKIVNGYGLGIGSSSNQFYANHIENCSIGASVVGNEVRSSNNVVYQNNFINNNQQVKNWGANTANFWDNGVIGNYWSDYNGTDADGDRIGDVPYFIRIQTFNASVGVIEVVCGQDNYPLMAPFDISVNLELPTWEYKPPSSPILPSQPTTHPPESTSLIEHQSENHLSLLSFAIVSSVVATIGIGTLIYFKKRHR